MKQTLTLNRQDIIDHVKDSIRQKMGLKVTEVRFDIGEQRDAMDRATIGHTVSLVLDVEPDKPDTSQR